MGAVIREEGGDQRIGHGFQRAVRIGENEHAPKEQIVGIVRRARAEGDERREDVADERQGDQFAVADLIHDDAADDDAEAEAGETRAADGAELRAGEAELLAPVIENAAANGEADAGGEDGHEAGPEQAFGVGRDAGVGGIGETIDSGAHGGGIWFWEVVGLLKGFPGRGA